MPEVARKTFILTVCLLCASAAARALSPVEYGVSAGAGWRNMGMDGTRAGIYSLSADPRMGFFCGIASRITLPWFHIQTEINYVAARYRLTAAPPPGQGAASASTVRMGFVEAPVLLGYKVGFIRLQAGPVFNLMAETSVSAPRSVSAGQSPPAHMVMCRMPAVGYAAGIAADISNVSFTLRYGGQFAEPVQTVGIGGERGVNVKTAMRAWSLGVGIYF